MVYFAATTGLFFHTCFWGAGLAALVVPVRLRAWWWVFAPSCGIALQSLVVWIGVQVGLAGTNVYAWPSELLPLGLAAVALWRRRQARGRMGRMGPLIGVAVITASVGLLTVGPMALAGKGLHTSSLGSCDHADYAAGARALAEFAPDDVTGFLGQSEVIRTGSTDNFFDFWIRLNHFSPAAILAHHSSILGVEIFRLVSVFAAALFLLNLPLVWFLARLVAGLRGWRAWLFLLLYGVSPLGQYGVHNGALGQLLAVNGLALVLVMTVWTERSAGSRRGAWRSLPLFAIAYWVLIGGYHFIVVVSLAQAGTWLAGMAWLRRDLRRALRTVGVLLAGLAVCAVAFAERFGQIVQRFSLFEKTSFGWHIPGLTIEGWLGLVRDAGLHGWSPAWRIALGIGFAGLWAVGLVFLLRRNRRQAVTLVALVLPVAVGWTILSWESLGRNEATYDAYKLLVVFRPGLLAGLCGGLILAAWNRRRAWIAGLAVVVLAGNIPGAVDFVRRISHPQLRTDRHLAALGRLERHPDIGGVNIRLATDWGRLWANYFLLRKRQYFPAATYEGRNATALAGDWTLYSHPLRIMPPHEEDAIALNDFYYAVRASASPQVAAQWGGGWYDPERSGSVQWRWAKMNGIIDLVNKNPGPVMVAIRVRASGVEHGRRLQLVKNRRLVHTGPLDPQMKWTTRVECLLPPGRSRIELRTERPGRRGSKDKRMLSVAVSQVEIRRLNPPVHSKAEKGKQSQALGTGISLD